MLKVNNTLNTVNVQKELPAWLVKMKKNSFVGAFPEVKAPDYQGVLRDIISTATRYAFESDDSVCLKGPNGALWVFNDGTVTPVSEEPGTNGYPSHYHPAHLVKAKELALRYLGL